MDDLQIPLLAGLPGNDARQTLRRLGAAERAYAKDETILAEGSTSGAIGILLSGRVHILQQDYWGNRTILVTIEPGDLFGEAYACIPGAVMEVSAVAADDSIVAFLDRSSLLHPRELPSASHMRLVENPLTILAEKNLRLTGKMAMITKRSTRDKLLSYLSAQALRQHTAFFTIPYDRQQLADFLSVDRSAMCAVLARLKREGILDYHKNTFRLLKNPEI